MKSSSMNHYAVGAVILAIMNIVLVACGGDSGSGANPSENEKSTLYSEVETVRDLGRCTENRDGDTVYVVEKLRDYICKNHAWVDASEEKGSEQYLSSSEKAKSNTNSSSSETTKSNDNSSSSETAKSSANSSSSKKSNTSSSSEIVKSSASSSSSKKAELEASSSSLNKDAYAEENLVVKKRSILGVAQKGPFKFGSPVYLRELSEDGLEYTGMVYQDEISSNKGDFVIPNVNLISPYACVEVRGLYRNEITGEYSKDSISLFALTDLKTALSDAKNEPRNKVNVNLLTHLEYKRALYLVHKGYSVYAAKKQADQEIMTAFELPTTIKYSEDLSVFEDSQDNNVNYANASLMMLSLLFLGEKSDAEIKNTIDKFIEDFEKDGAWDDEQTKVSMADYAAEINSTGIRTNVKAWNVLDIPKFEEPLEMFWNNVYGLGSCTDLRSGVILKNKNSRSKNADVYYKCSWNQSKKVGNWVKATQLEYDTFGNNCLTDGSIVAGNIITSNKYVCDAGSFRTANDLEITLEKGCVSFTENDEITKLISDRMDSVYICKNHLWAGSVKARDGYLLDDRDHKIYKTVVIGTQTWMAENLNYSDSAIYLGMKGRSWCYKNSVDGCAKYGRYYTWATAMDSAGTFSSNGKGCGCGKKCSPTYPVRGICPEGWHLPTRSEWYTLYSAMRTSPYAMQAIGYDEWPKATDAYGFSALPVDFDYYGNNCSYVGVDAVFWSATENINDNVDLLLLTADAVHFDYNYKFDTFSVRCLQD